MTVWVSDRQSASGYQAPSSFFQIFTYLTSLWNAEIQNIGLSQVIDFIPTSFIQGIIFKALKLMILFIYLHQTIATDWTYFYISGSVCLLKPLLKLDHIFGSRTKNYTRTLCLWGITFIAIWSCSMTSLQINIQKWLPNQQICHKISHYCHRS